MKRLAIYILVSCAGVLVSYLAVGFQANGQDGFIPAGASSQGPARFTVALPQAAQAASTGTLSLNFAGGNGSNVAPQGTATFTITMPNAAQAASTGTLSLNFTGNAVNAGTTDPEVAFTTANPTFFFSAGQTTATLNPTNVAVQAGTVAGTITASTPTFTGFTQSPVATGTVVVPRSAPKILQVVVGNRTATGFNVCVTGFSTTRDMTAVGYTFAQSTASGAGTLSTTSLSAPASTITAFTTMYTGAASVATGGQFLLDQNFTLSGGTDAAIGSVTVTLTNSTGATSSTITYPPATTVASCD